MSTVDRVRFETSPRARPSTPHPRPPSESKDFHFNSSEKSGELDEESLTDGCIGISLSTVNGFFPSFKEIVRNTLKPLNCAEGQKSGRASFINTPTSTSDDNLDEYDLMNRLQSWKTLESRSKAGPTPNVSKKSVQFQYPPITSVRLRPRTESDEIDLLFFAPDELDQIEDDRSDTKAADDIETLCVIADPYDMESVPGMTESIGASRSDEMDPNGLSFIGQRSNSSMSPSNCSSGRKKKRGIVRGVQILLREKSLG